MSIVIITLILVCMLSIVFSFSYSPVIGVVGVTTNTGKSLLKTITLPYSKDLFAWPDTLKSINLVNNETAILNGGDLTILYKPINENINYIETTFRIINETDENNNAGIAWNIGQKNWYAFLRPHSLGVWSDSVDMGGEKQIQTITRENGTWYTLKVLVTENTINIYLNDVLQSQIPRSMYENGGITQVGIRAFNTAAEFKAIKLSEMTPAANTLTNTGAPQVPLKSIFGYYFPHSKVQSPLKLK